MLYAIAMGQIIKCTTAAQILAMPMACFDNKNNGIESKTDRPFRDEENLLGRRRILASTVVICPI